MKLLFVNQYYAPDYAATAQIMADLCEDLAAQGHEVHVLASCAVYDGRSLELPEYEVRNGVHVHRVHISSPSRTRIRQRALGYLSFLAKAFVRLHSLPKPDAVIVLTTPPMIGLAGTWMRFIRRTRFIYWVMDIYPDIALKAGVIKPYGPVRGLWSALGRFALHSANRIIVLGQDMREAIVSKGITRDKVDVVTCWSSGEEVYPIESENPFRMQHMDPDAFTLMYSGNMGVCHCFKSVIEGMNQLSYDEGLRFLFVGGGKREAQIRDGLAGKEFVSFLPYQDRADLAASLSAPDAHLVTLDPLFDGLLIPSKIYGIMAASRATLFVGSEENQIALILRRFNCGIVVPPEDPEAFLEAVRWMAANRDEVREMGRRGRAAFESHYDREICTEYFSDILAAELSETPVEIPAAPARKPGADSPIPREVVPVAVQSDAE